MTKNRRRIIKSKVVETKDQLEWVSWSIYDEINYLPNETIRENINLMCNPLGTVNRHGRYRGLDETNLEMCGILPAPQKFHPSNLYLSKLSDNYFTTKFINNFILEYWVMMKVYARVPLTELPSYTDKDIGMQQNFKLSLIGKSFITDEIIRIRFGILGMIGRGIC
jgi:hypothetical protein